MKTKKTYLLIFFLGILIIPQLTFAQDKEEEEIFDELGVATNRFQEHFFEALKQKGIENYDRALRALEKAALESPNEVVIYYEMAKNYGLLKQWDKAEENYNKVLQIKPNSPEANAGLYDVFYNTTNYTKAIELVKKLIPFDRDYKEDLANLYERTQQYDKALQLLDELDQELGTNEYRNQLRQQIYSKSDDTGGQISDLEQRINRTPANEQDFLNLIYLYSEQDNKEAAFATAKKLIEVNPNSHLAHLALYKFYLDQGKTNEAIHSMKKVFVSDIINQENKFKVLNDFLLFVNENPAFEKKLEEMVALFSSESNNKQVYKQLGDYYLNKNMKTEALQYFELGLKGHATDYHLIKNTLLLQIEFNKYEDAETLSKNSLDIFPSQPLLYLLNGVANLHLENTSKAKTMFETGLDFLIDDGQMERDFYLQLSEAHKKEGNSVKATQYLNKAKEVAEKN